MIHEYNGCMKNGLPSAKTPGFSLIELLTVMGVSVILLALLFAGIFVAKKRSENIECIFNLRTFGVGIHAYAADHQMQLPPGSLAGSEWFKANTQSWVYNYVLQGDILKIAKLYRCPTDKTVSDYKYYYSYTWNGRALQAYTDAFTPAHGRPHVKLWQVTHTILMADGLSKSESFAIKANYPSQIVEGNALTRLSRRHNAGVNVLTGDGGVQWLPTEEAAESERILPKDHPL